MFVYYGQVTGHHGFSTALHKIKSLLLIGRIQIIKKDPANASRLSSVTDVEIVVAPSVENKNKF